MVFGDKFKRNRFFSVNGKQIEVVDSFKYLGIIFSKNRLFASAKKHLCEQAKKALFSLKRKIRNLDLSIDCQIKLFEATIIPILTYGCEVWGNFDVSLLEKVHTDYLKYILNVKTSTPHIMLYGDLGRFPIVTEVKKRVIGFWYNIIVNPNKLSSLLYKFMHSDYVNRHSAYKWLDFVKSILDECGLSYIWFNQMFDGSKEVLLHLVEQSLKDQYRQSWHSQVYNSSKALNYRMYKNEHKYETYLDILPCFYRQHFVNFRMCNNVLPIEKLRWSNIDRNERKCKICNLNEIGDEYHYLFKCTSFNEPRNKYLLKKYRTNVNCVKFDLLMNEKNETVLRNLAKFITIILKSVKNSHLANP